MPDSNIVVGGAAIVGSMVLDGGNADLRATASPSLLQKLSVRLY